MKPFELPGAVKRVRHWCCDGSTLVFRLYCIWRQWCNIPAAACSPDCHEQNSGLRFEPWAWNAGIHHI